MLDWIFEGIVTWISSIVSQMMDAVSGIFLNALGTDMTAMEEYFPFVSKAFTIMQYTAWALLFLITVWQLFRVFGGPITEAENPMSLLARSSLFALLIGYAKPIFEITLDIARAPYAALMEVAMTSEDFTFAGIEQALSNGLTTVISVVSVVGLLLLIILEIALGWNYFKLLLETVERYVVVGVLCYTSPLAYAVGASKATSNVFKSWCRMVGSQLLLRVMNVWFLRAFNSSVAQYISNGGALSTGQGSIFLWMFCALAFLKTAQKFDSYLASIGLNVAQTGSSMGMELLMAARVISGLSSGVKSAGKIFSGGSAVSGAAGTGFANIFKGNSYVRDAVVNGGSRMGARGTLGFVGRAFGGMAARNGAKLTADSISSVASKMPNISGSIAGDIADRSLSNFMPHLGGRNLSGTQISGGQISTTSICADGKETQVAMYSAAQYEKPDVPHAVVSASDGSKWFQMASGSGADDFYASPKFTGDSSESSKVAEAFPNAADGTVLRTADDGVIEASVPGEGSFLYNSASYAEPNGPHSVVTDSDGNQWYQVSAADISNGAVEAPQFTGGNTVSFPEMDADTSFNAIGDGVVEASSADGNSLLYSSACYDEPAGPHSVVTADDGSQWYQLAGEDIANGTVSSPNYIGNTSETGDGAVQSDISFSGMPEGTTFSPVGNGVVQTETSSDSNTLWYSSANYEEPDAPHTVMQAANGVDWYAMKPDAQSPEFESGDAALAYNQAQFQAFMPGYEQKVTNVDGSQRQDGQFEVRHENGSGTMFYDTARYVPPKGDYQVYEDAKGGQWYAIKGDAAVDRKPVYKDGKPVYEDGKLKTINIETVRYKTTPSRFEKPKRRERTEIKTPKRKR